MTEEKLSSVDQKINDLERRIKHRLGTVDNAKIKYRDRYTRLSIFLSVLAAVNTLLIAMSQRGVEPWWGFAVAALLVSALVSIVSGLDGLLKPREKHAQNAEALNEVYDIKQRLEWRKLSGEEITEHDIDTFFERFRNLEKSFFNGITKINLQDSSN